MITVKTHFTLKGRYAGQTYCGAIRNEKDKYMHIQASNTTIMKELLEDGSNLCKGCKDVYLLPDDEE